MEEPGKRDPVTLYMDFYKAKIQYYVSLDELKLITVVIGYL